jgi:predicted cupin superfamily sugar epimerase
MDTQIASHWIERLGLQPHPEGGHYREVFRSEQKVLHNRSSAIKYACTSIYYLLEGTDYSGFHRIASDEIWYFHKGMPLLLHVIDDQGLYKAFELSDLETGTLSIAIKAGLWFAAEVPSRIGFTLASCAVAPGFEFNEFEMAEKAALISQYPAHTHLLDRLCRK